MGAPSTNEVRGAYETKSSRFDRLVAQYYPAGYSIVARFTDNPSEAVVLMRGAFYSARKRAEDLRNPTAIALTLISAVMRADLRPPNLRLRISKICVAAASRGVLLACLELL
jgi:hypothetical protein